MANGLGNWLAGCTAGRAGRSCSKSTKSRSARETLARVRFLQREHFQIGTMGRAWEARGKKYNESVKRKCKKWKAVPYAGARDDQLGWAGAELRIGMRQRVGAVQNIAKGAARTSGALEEATMWGHVCFIP